MALVVIQSPVHIEVRKTKLMKYMSGATSQKMVKIGKSRMDLKFT